MNNDFNELDLDTFKPAGDEPKTTPQRNTKKKPLNWRLSHNKLMDSTSDTQNQTGDMIQWNYKVNDFAPYGTITSTPSEVPL
ncbi:hypothetical protein K9N54_26045 (plasmid) [Vibrio parahaemolyticus]|uniref:hypothetical protein n=1 Tax=Vibrio parahaemolyticus TaxID=670 RepID=UPI001CC33A6A|nr:hypothetical protein [Vibrio parahaemolyticus]UAY45813.1 hypothetical protein K9N54_26045 [Vibrio parahaemolyticus]